MRDSCPNCLLHLRGDTLSYDTLYKVLPCSYSHGIYPSIHIVNGTICHCTDYMSAYFNQGTAS